MPPMNTPIPAPTPVRGLHHFAWRCRDAEETRHFYEDLLGLPLVHVIKSDHVPSTGEYCPYVHIFFQMADGAYIAFFDPNGIRLEFTTPTVPKSTMDAHALRARAELDAWTARKAQLLAAGEAPHPA